MKHRIIIIAVILYALVSPGTAQATFSEDCQNALTDLPPVSLHFTQRVLERATAALAYVNTETSHSDFKQYLPSWIRAIETAMLSLLDTELRIVESQRDILQNTACLRIDMYLIECKIDEVRAAFHQAVIDKRTGALLRLQSLIDFLNRHLQILIGGARDPSYQDPDWHRSYIFDDSSGPYQFGSSGPTTSDSSCGNAIVELGEECDSGPGCTEFCQTEMCPFHTDYLPPNTIGFGCDIGVLTPRTMHRPTYDEWASLTALTEEVSLYFSQAQQIMALQEQVGVSPIAPAPRLHRTGFGCLRSVCEFNRNMQCTKQSDCQRYGVGSCLYGLTKGTCERNPLLSCMKDLECGSGDRCIQINDATWWELRGPFSIEKDEPRILDVFRQKREADGEGREFPVTYKLPASSTNQSTGFGMILQLLARPVLQIFSRTQEQGESAIFPIGSDPLLAMQWAISPLRDAVGEFSRLSGTRGGMRDFAIAFAYFIRRTCVYKPCNMILEKIIRIALADACFPYTDGAFLSDSCENPRAKKCIEAAELDTDMGFPIPENKCGTCERNPSLSCKNDMDCESGDRCIQI